MADICDDVHTRLLSLPKFFVGGVARSGTTWTQKLLDAHPEVLCLGETEYASNLVPGLYDVLKKYSAQRQRSLIAGAPGIRGPEAEQFRPIQQVAFAALAAANLGDKTLDRLVAVGEKTPDNLSWMERLWWIFPSARFIHVIRDPRDAAVSAFIRFRDQLPQEYTREKYFDLFSRTWSERIRAARNLAEGRETYLEVRFEDLHADTAAKARELFRFLGASTDPGLVNAAVESASFEQLSRGRKAGDEDMTSHYRTGEVGAWNGALTTPELAIIERQARPLMDDLGYL